MPEKEPALDFSVNVNPLGPPRSILAALSKAMRGIVRYPEMDSCALTARLAALHDVARDQIVVANGSTDLIYAIARACRPARVAIAEPTFTEYLRASLLVGAVTEHWLAEESHFQLEPFDPGTAELVWLCNPNNPTGCLWPAKLLRDWIRHQRNTLFVVDEAFVPFLEKEGEHSLVAETSAAANLIVLRSMTKVYAIPGLRLGYAVTDLKLAHAIRTQIAPWSVNNLAQVAGLAALEDSRFLGMTRAWFKAERKAFDDILASLAPHLEIIPSQANFSLLRLRHSASGGLVQALAERGIAVREASNFIGLSAGHFRVAVRMATDNERLIDAMRRQLAIEN